MKRKQNTCLHVIWRLVGHFIPCKSLLYSKVSNFDWNLVFYYLKMLEITWYVNFWLGLANMWDNCIQSFQFWTKMAWPVIFKMPQLFCYWIFLNNIKAKNKSIFSFLWHFNPANHFVVKNGKTRKEMQISQNAPK